MVITSHGKSYEITTEAQLIQWLAQRSPEAMAKFLATLPVRRTA